MKTCTIFFCFAIFGITISLCEKRVPRQIWGRPLNHNPLWHADFQGFGGGRDFYNSPIEKPWSGNSGFGRPVRNQMNFQRERDNDYFNRPSRNQNNFPNGGESNDFFVGGSFDPDRNKRPNSNNKPNQNQNANQNKRTTTPSEPLTTTPTTIHYAPQGCNCPITQQFNPVCGTDGNTYKNEGLLNCYKRCGTRVSQKRLGTCS